MQSTIALAAIIARLAAAQDFNFDDVLNAPSPSLTAPPLTAAASNATSVYSVATSSLSVSIDASVVTAAATASITGASASAASTQTPDASAIDKRGLMADMLNDWGFKTTSAKTTLATSVKTSSSSSSSVKSTSTSSSSVTSKSSTSSSVQKTSSTSATSSTSSTSSSIQPTTSSASSTTVQQSSTTTTSSDTSCPTQPEAGTYCGFINPEDPCALQPDGYGPQVQPDTVAAFLAYPEFQSDALTAPTPYNYTQVFKDLNAATSANSYLGFYTLDSYNTTECAAHCDTTDLCTSFNIYIERDPSLNPTYNESWTNYWNGTTDVYSCPNPASITNYKCSLWGSSIDNTSATNTGGWRGDFQSVVTASNGYDKTNNTVPATIPAWTAPTNCSSGGAISAGGNYWMGSNFFPGPFDPSVCGIYAQAQTAKNKQVAISKGANSYVPCNMFNAYAIHKNGVPQGTYCSLYDAVLSSEWAAFKGAWSGNNFFGVHSSWTYALSNLDSGKC